MDAPPPPADPAGAGDPPQPDGSSSAAANTTTAAAPPAQQQPPPPPPQRPASRPPPAPPARGRSTVDEEDDDVVVEMDPSGRYGRYGTVVGSGRFKTVYRGFDERAGIDVAWSKVGAAANGLDAGGRARVAAEMAIGLQLDHPNIIRSYKCWESQPAGGGGGGGGGSGSASGEASPGGAKPGSGGGGGGEAGHDGHPPSAPAPAIGPCVGGCVNLITEYFTSGNLRDYRARHKHLDLRAVRKWARQILAGLHYLHTSPGGPIIHGDLRCDKIYINGHSGEIKIGDVGLATLAPKRFAPGVLPAGVVADEGDGGGGGGGGGAPASPAAAAPASAPPVPGSSPRAPAGQYTPAVDIFAFGLCVLELATCRRVDAASAASWPSLLEGVKDPGAAAFIRRCLAPSPGARPTAGELLEDAFLAKKAVTTAASTAAFGGGAEGGGGGGGGLDGGGPSCASLASLGGGGGGGGGAAQPGLSSGVARHPSADLSRGGSGALGGGGGPASSAAGSGPGSAAGGEGGGGGPGGGGPGSDGGAPPPPPPPHAGPGSATGGPGSDGGAAPPPAAGTPVAAARPAGGPPAPAVAALAHAHHHRPSLESEHGGGASEPGTAAGGGGGGEHCAVGAVRGEDFTFQFSGRVRGGSLHFRLVMAPEGSDDDDESRHHHHHHRRGGGDDGSDAPPDLASRPGARTIDFVYDPDADTPDDVAAEIGSEFGLSPTDRDICAAALKEWLASLPSDGGGGLLGGSGGGGGSDG